MFGACARQQQCITRERQQYEQSHRTAQSSTAKVCRGLHRGSSCYASLHIESAQKHAVLRGPIPPSNQAFQTVSPAARYSPAARENFSIGTPLRLNGQASEERVERHGLNIIPGIQHGSQDKAPPRVCMSCRNLFKCVFVVQMAFNTASVHERSA